MKTVQDIVAWLNTQEHIKCILVDISEIGNSPEPELYLSSMPYTYDNKVYSAVVTGGLSFSESLSIEGSPSMGYGSLEITNVAGIYDSYIGYVWNKRPIKIYLGDPTWTKSDFILIFDGLIQELTAPNESTLSFSVFDKLQRLNNPLSEKTLKDTGYSQNTQDTVLPLLFGECFNITPLLVDNGSTNSGGQVYMLHDGAVSGVVEVRDNGIPIAVEPDLTAGTFELLTQPYGTITCSAQGDTPYTNTVPGIVQKLVTEYGTAENRFQLSELAFEDFANTSPVGLYCSDRRNVLEVCTELAKSVNANLVCPAVTITNGTVTSSKLKLVEIKSATGTPVYYLNDNNMLVDSLSISEMFPVKPSIKLAYCKNHTIQTTVAAGLNPVSKFEDQYIFVSAVNAAAKTLYRDSGDTAEEETLLIATASAQAEADKRLQLWQQQRFIVTANYLPELIFVQLGDIVQVQTSRFGLANGKLGMVYSVTRDWVTGLVSIGVLI
jgi:hypothetical protein